MCVTTTGGGTALLQQKGKELTWVHQDAGQTTWLGLFSPHSRTNTKDRALTSDMLVTSNSKGMLHAFSLPSTSHKTVILKSKKTFSRDLAIISAEWHPERRGLLATTGLDRMVRVVLF